MASSSTMLSFGGSLTYSPEFVKMLERNDQRLALMDIAYRAEEFVEPKDDKTPPGTPRNGQKKHAGEAYIVSFSKAPSKLTQLGFSCCAAPASIKANPCPACWSKQESGFCKKKWYNHATITANTFFSFVDNDGKKTPKLETVPLVEENGMIVGHIFRKGVEIRCEIYGCQSTTKDLHIDVSRADKYATSAHEKSLRSVSPRSRQRRDDTDQQKTDQQTKILQSIKADLELFKSSSRASDPIYTTSASISAIDAKQGELADQLAALIAARTAANNSKQQTSVLPADSARAFQPSPRSHARSVSRSRNSNRRK